MLLYQQAIKYLIFRNCNCHNAIMNGYNAKCNMNNAVMNTKMAL